MYERDLTRNFNEKFKQSTEFVDGNAHNNLLVKMLLAILIYFCALLSITILKTSAYETSAVASAIFILFSVSLNVYSNRMILPLEVLTELANATLAETSKAYLKSVAHQELTLKDLKVVLKHQSDWLEQDLKVRRANQTQLIRSKLV